MSARVLVLGALVVAVLATFVVTRGGDDRYMTRVVLSDSGGLRKGSNVRINGAPAGTVAKLELDDQDRAVAELRIEDGAAPIGTDAKALVQADGFFGERYVELDRGSTARPARDGATIPLQRSGVSTRVDDVIDALDVDTRQALQVFLRESGVSLVGRGKDLGEVLQALPPGLMETGKLVDAFAKDNEALGLLVERSDRVVATVARERKQLGRLVGSAGETLDVLASRREGLRETVRRAPGTLQAARQTLVTLDDAARQLIPAARGLRSTAPALANTLEQLPDFTEDAVPALRSVSAVAPKLQRLANEGTPVVRRIAPLATDLTGYTNGALGPFTDTLDQAAPDTIAVLEGWSRSTQGRDAASQIFRFGATSGSDIFAALLKTPATKGGAKAKRAPASTPGAGPAPAPAADPTPSKPDAKEPALPGVVKDPVGKVQDLVGGLLPPAGEPQRSPATPQELLDFLLGP